VTRQLWFFRMGCNPPDCNGQSWQHHQTCAHILRRISSDSMRAKCYRKRCETGIGRRECSNELATTLSCSSFTQPEDQRSFHLAEVKSERNPPKKQQKKPRMGGLAPKHRPAPQKTDRPGPPPLFAIQPSIVPPICYLLFIRHENILANSIALTYVVHCGVARQMTIQQKRIPQRDLTFDHFVKCPRRLPPFNHVCCARS